MSLMIPMRPNLDMGRTVDRVRRHQDPPGQPGEDPVLVPRRGDEAGDHQLPDLQAGAGRPLLREDLRADHRLGVPLRQVQAHEAPGRHLRQVRGRGHPVQSAPRADGAHRARLPGVPRLVLQGAPSRIGHLLDIVAPRPRAGPLLRVLRGDGPRGLPGGEAAGAGERRPLPRAPREVPPAPRRWARRRSRSSCAASTWIEDAVGAPRGDADRELCPEEDQVREAPQGGGGLPEERQQRRSG